MRVGDPSPHRYPFTTYAHRMPNRQGVVCASDSQFCPETLSHFQSAGISHNPPGPARLCQSAVLAAVERSLANCLANEAHRHANDTHRMIWHAAAFWVGYFFQPREFMDGESWIHPDHGSS